MKKLLLAIAVLTASISGFAQVETSGLDHDKNVAFMQEHLYKLDDFQKGTVVNIEFDVFGKYVQRLLEQYLEAQK